MWIFTKQWTVAFCAGLMLLAGCIPTRGPREDRAPLTTEKQLERQDSIFNTDPRDEEVEGDPRDDAVIIYGEELDDDPLLRVATWNINRYSENKARKGRPGLQPASATVDAGSLQALMTYWLIENGVDMVAMQEILDLQPFITGATDPDFPELDGYTMLPGPKIKGWLNNTVAERCPIYYRPTQVKSCVTVATAAMPLQDTHVHWARCTTIRDKEFWCGCAHPAYGNVAGEVQVLTNRMKAWQGITPRREYILGMDANSYHAGRGSEAWGKFRDSLGIAFRNVTSEWTPDFTKISKRGNKVGPSANPQNHILDWLLFDVSVALRYKDNSMSVIALPRDTRGYTTATPAKSRKFLKEYHEHVSDHLPVKADFHIQ